MSAYVDFFVRNGDDFIPLGDFSRNTIIYHTMMDCTNVPWEKRDILRLYKIKHHLVSF